MILLLFFSFFASADKKNQKKSSSIKDSKRELKVRLIEKNHLSKKINSSDSIVKISQNINEKHKPDKYEAENNNQDSFKGIADSIQKIKDGIEIYKIKNRYYDQNDDQINDQNKQTNQRNKMFDILDKIRERYAPPTTPVSRITFSSIFITFLVIGIIIIIAYFLISHFFRIKSSEINDEELPLILGQINQEQHDLSVHGFSKI